MTALLFAFACGTPPAPAIPAAKLQLLNDQGQPVDVGDAGWETALYYHETDPTTPYTGPIEASYTNGNKRLLAYVKKGRLDGESIVWFAENEREQWMIDYRSGRIEAFKEYDQNGTLVVEYPESPGVTNIASTNGPPQPPGTNDIRLSLLELRGALIYHVDEMIFPFTGTAVELWTDGTLKKRETFEEGEHHGSLKWWHANGKPWYSATYQRGLPDGRVEAWREDGTREYVYTWQDSFPASKITYAPDGTESGRVENDMGTLIYYHPNGNKKLEETYEGNILSPSKQVWFDENGLQIDPPPTPPPLAPPEG